MKSSLFKCTYPFLLSQSLREAIKYESDIKQDKHILSFSLYELALIHIEKTEVVYIYYIQCQS